MKTQREVKVYVVEVATVYEGKIVSRIEVYDDKRLAQNAAQIAKNLGWKVMARWQL